ncbi:hypothetical protein BH23VER1_BH23VER1_24200 [soil metagenome]
MSSLTAIKGVGATASKLLAAAGIDGTESLAAQELGTLYPRLEAANDEVAAFRRLPARSVVGGWIEAARSGTDADGDGGTDAETHGDAGTEGETEAEDAEDGEAGGPSFPSLEEIPVARDYFDAEGGRIGVRSLSRPSGPVAVAEGAPGRKPLDFSRIHTFGDVQDGRVAVAPLGGSSTSRPLAPPIQARKLERIDAAEGATVSRWVMRGIQHPHPIRLYFAMLTVFISRLLFFAVCLGAPFVLGRLWLTGENHVQSFLPVTVAFVAFGIVHLLIASRVRCKVCSCHLLFARRCHKNIKAHRLFPLGWVGSTALHGIVFRWFRCMYCGTPTQLQPRQKPK